MSKVAVVVREDLLIEVDGQLLPQKEVNNDQFWETLAAPAQCSREALQKLVRDEWARWLVEYNLTNDVLLKRDYLSHKAVIDRYLPLLTWSHAEFADAYVRGAHRTVCFRDHLQQCRTATGNSTTLLEFFEAHPSMSESQREHLFRTALLDTNLTENAILERLEPPVNNDSLSAALYDQPFQNLFSGELSAPEALASCIELLRPLCSSQHRGATEVYSRYCAVVQGSGAGKTRLAFELQSHYFLIYICLRPKGSSGFPARSHIADLFLQLHEIGAAAPNQANTPNEPDVMSDDKADKNILKQKEQFSRFFAALFAKIGENAENWMANVGAEDLPLRRKRFLESTHENTAFWNSVKEEYRRRAYAEYDVGNTMKMALRRLEGKTGTNQPVESSFVIVLDEASAMLNDAVLPEGQLKKRSHFAAWRRSLHSISADDWFFLLLDTHSSVTNFHPLYKDDPSMRLMSCKYLCPPFFSFPFTGPWALDHLSVTSQLMDSIAPCSLHTARDLLCFSRPLYMAAASGATFTDIVNLAVGKLCGVATVNLSSVLCFRYAVRPNYLELKDDLLRSHAATLLAMDPLSKHSDFIVCYLPEAMLGEAAYTHVRNRRITFSDVANELFQRMQNGHLAQAYSKGDCGEFAAMTYLLEVMDRAFHAFKKEQNSGDKTVLRSTPIPLHYWLSSLAGGANIKALFAKLVENVEEATNIPGLRRGRSQARQQASHQRKVEIRDNVRALRKATLQHCLLARMNFTGWFEARSSVDQDSLEYALAYRVGWVAPPNEPATDLLLSLGLQRSDPPLTAAFSTLDLSRDSPTTTTTTETVTCVADEKTYQQEEGDEEETEEENNEEDEMINENIERFSVRLHDDLDAAPAALQIINYDFDVFLLVAFTILRKQSKRQFLLTPNAPIVLSMLFMVGKGQVTIAKVPRSSPLLVFVPFSHDNQVDAKSVYIVVNRFAALSAEEESALQKLLSIRDIGEKANLWTAAIKTIASAAPDLVVPEKRVNQVSNFFHNTLYRQLGTKAPSRSTANPKVHSQKDAATSSQNDFHAREWDSVVVGKPKMRVFFLSDPVEKKQENAIAKIRLGRRVKTGKKN